MLRVLAKMNAILVVLLVGASAPAEEPNRDLSSATIPPGSAGSILLIHPLGTGHPFQAARLAGGIIVNATITLNLVYGESPALPLADYPAEDLWLETSGGGLGFAPGGTIADAPTDGGGHTQWAEPLFAGGCTPGETVIVMAGEQPLSQPGLPLEFNSADHNGDLALDLADVTFFSIAYFGTYDPTEDLWFDGAINLADFTIFAQGYFP
jgi:hypothetical protein